MEDPYQARAEAWYQIRYVHADQLHKRRYIEAEVFGLYNDRAGPASLEEALSVYRWYTSRRREDMASYDLKHSKEIQAANQDLLKIYPSLNVEQLADELNLAARFLREAYQMDNYVHVYANNIVVASDTEELDVSDIHYSVLIASDKGNTLRGSRWDNWLIGGDGTDYLYGGLGADHLIGGAGDDYLDAGSVTEVWRGQEWLVGGEGFDTYTLSPEPSVAHQNIIIDSDGLGKVIFRGVTLSNAFGYLGNGIYYDEYGNQFEYSGFDYDGVGDVIITSRTTGQCFVIFNFKNGDLGIILHHIPPSEDMPFPDSMFNFNKYQDDAAISAKQRWNRANMLLPEELLVLGRDDFSHNTVGANGYNEFLDFDRMADGDAEFTSFSDEMTMNRDMLGVSNIKEHGQTRDLNLTDKNYAVLVDALNAFDPDSDVESEDFIPTRLLAENCHYY